jgi:hypothetical protein
MKIRSVGAKLFYSDGRAGGQKKKETDTRTAMAKVTNAFRNFANAPKYPSFLGTISNIKPIFTER